MKYIMTAFGAAFIAHSIATGDESAQICSVIFLCSAALAHEIQRKK